MTKRHGSDRPTEGERQASPIRCSIAPSGKAARLKRRTSRAIEQIVETLAKCGVELRRTVPPRSDLHLPDAIHGARLAWDCGSRGNR